MTNGATYGVVHFSILQARACCAVESPEIRKAPLTHFTFVVIRVGGSLNYSVANENVAMYDLSRRLKALRYSRKITLDQLARRSNLTKSYLSKVERGVSEPSISTVLKLAKAYNVDISDLIGSRQDGDEDDEVSVVRVAERTPLARANNRNGYRYEALAGRRMLRAMNPFIVFPPHVGEGTHDVFPHSGEEFMLILKGSVAITVSNRSYQLEEGDTIYFESTLPHRLFSTSELVAEVLVVASDVTAR